MFDLEAKDRNLAVNCLASDFFNSPNPRNRLRTIVGEVALDLEEQFTPHAWAMASVDLLQKQEWTLAGHPLLLLLEVIAPLHQDLSALVQRLSALPKPPNPLLAKRLETGVFLDRETLRQHVESLLASDGPCVLRVQGQPKSGRSTCFQFLKHLHTRSKSLHPVRVQSQGFLTAACDLAQTLINRMGEDPSTIPPIAGETPLRAGQILADWVLNRALRSRSRWWFVLDDYSDPNLPEDTKEFIRQLALQIASGIGRDRLRLVLINSEVPLPMELRRLQKVEKLEINRPLWQQYLTDYMEEWKQQLPPEKAGLVDTAKQVILEELATQPDHLYLETLWTAIEDTHDEFAA